MILLSFRLTNRFRRSSLSLHSRYQSLTCINRFRIVHEKDVISPESKPCCDAKTVNLGLYETGYRVIKSGSFGSD